MKHAGPGTLDRIEPLLAQVRTRTGLKERKRGIFYRNGRSFLHFHEDPAGIFADLADGSNDIRLRVSTVQERKTLLTMLDHCLGTSSLPGSGTVRSPTAKRQPRVTSRSPSC